MNKTIKGLILGIVIGATLMFPVSSFASSITEFILVNAQYPIIVDDNLYEGELPIPNYEGSTYVPLRTMSELLDVNIFWNETLRQVEISHDDSVENQAFRNITVSGSNGNYVVTGEARVYEATIQYEVEDGHYIFLEGSVNANEGALDWGTFNININIPEEDLPRYGTLMLILFEESADDGSRVNELPVVLEILS
ncbi:MAG: Gmad2 immunoglobulin-like domain-containing protein [Bacillota bacterium]|nr:Gmad2 immunoglobulin-like domain-containing protein [Bacillota bacterium]